MMSTCYLVNAYSTGKTFSWPQIKADQSGSGVSKIDRTLIFMMNADQAKP